jgi:phosphatidylethanolamine-binding protein (PEBP) family uncharacterized protein
MYDPDVPTQSKPAWLHWIRIYTSKGSYHDIVPYQKPSPPPKTGIINEDGNRFHRYIFSLYNIPNQSKITPLPRSNFDVTVFLSKYNIPDIPIIKETIRVLVHTI